MKINQVEELVDITKKNIRYYEDEGLIKPRRNSENGYREYSMEDVERLLKIRLLRQLSIPIEEIRRILAGDLTFKECMENQLVLYNHRQHDLELMKDLCSRMAREVESFEKLNASEYLERMRLLEEGEISLMDVKNTDVRGKKKVGPTIAAGVAIAYMVFLIVVVLWGNSQDRLPIPALLAILVLPLIMIVCIIVALRQRMKEINGGEEDEASKY